MAEHVGRAPPALHGDPFAAARSRLRRLERARVADVHEADAEPVLPRRAARALKRRGRSHLEYIYPLEG